MKGSYHIKIETKKVKYEFKINRNITIIQGDSATGKTTLIKCVDDFYNEGKSSGVKIECKKTCVVLRGKNWLNDLNVMKDSIVFIDEGNKFIKSRDFAEAIKHTDNYYVLVTRESIDALPYSVHEIYGLRVNGKIKTGEPTYNEMYRIYGKYNTDKEINPDVIITEDKNSGFQFFENVCTPLNIDCISAEGKANIKKYIKSDYQDKKVVIIADGAAYGPQINETMEYLEEFPNYVIYLPESFEWIILKAEIIRSDVLKKILEEPSVYIDSTQYFSWEQYFTNLLERLTTDHEIIPKYNKSKLPGFYKSHGNSEKILKQLDSIKLKRK